MKKLTLLFLIPLLSLSFVGCATTDAKADDDDDDEYIYVTSTNSRIPRKVKKGSTYQQDAGSSPMGSVSGQKAKDYLGGAPAASSGGD